MLRKIIQKCKHWSRDCETVALTGFIIVILVTLSGCSKARTEISDAAESTEATVQPTIEIEETMDINSITLQDDASIYLQDDEDSVVTMYLTVRRGNSADATDHTWAEVNQYSIYDYLESNDERYGVEAILQIGDENGPIPGEVGYHTSIPNATVRVRGASTSSNQQKSYKIELLDKAGTWRGQKTIALNKHVYDRTRLRNKLCFDYMKEIPNMISLRTQFVHLYVKDETESSSTQGFVDYGLYTQVEQPNKRYLRNHGLDRNGQFYKATAFEFYRYEDAIRLKTDPLFDLATFESVLEVKGNEDHSKLIEMLEKVNDYGYSIEEIFPYYFNEENYFTWLAFTILTGNVDTQSQNYYLYSPTNSHTWYFIPWDYDGSLSRYEDEVINQVSETGYEEGISNYWGVVLHRRVLALPKYRKQLDNKIKELLKIMTPEKTKSMVEAYQSVVKQYSFRMPDQMFLSATPEQWEDICNELPKETERNYQLYLQSLEKPMPYYLMEPEATDNKLEFKWETAYDLDAEDITYHFELSNTYLFEERLVDQDGLLLPSYSIDMLEPGQYFCRVTATNESGYSQRAFDYYVDTKSVKHYGVMCFYVDEYGGVMRGGMLEDEN